jgi:uncharacterized protein YggT (Ycf19 family)
VNLIDFILSVVALLLWLSWRAAGLVAAATPSPLSLVATLKRAEPLPAKRGLSLVGLGILLGVRGIIYWQVGPSLNWVPTLDLGAVTLHFRSQHFEWMLLFSLLSFARVLGIFYLWLLLLAIVNRAVPDTEPLQRIVRLQLGSLAHWPVLAQLLLPPLAMALLWLVLSWPLSRLGLLSLVAGALGLATFLAWKYLLIGLMLVHLVNSYVYVGISPVWNFLCLSGRHLLQPLQALPLRVGKLDLLPVAAIVVVWLITYFAARGLALLYARPLW